jgi:hypothetical protein
VRERVERAIVDESNDNPFGRPIPCNERWFKSGA